MEAIKKIELSKVIKITLVTFLGTLLLAMSAKIQTPLVPVPVTMQTFAVLLLGMSLDIKLQQQQ